MAITYERGGRQYTFDPLPANRDTAKFYLALGALSRNIKNIAPSDVLDLVGSLPACIERSMRAHHDEVEIEAFVDTVTLDFGNPESLTVLSDLNLLFVGIDPAASKDAKTQP